MKSDADSGFLMLAKASEWLGIILTFTLPILVVGNITTDFDTPVAIGVAIAAAFVGYVFADFLSGLVHWAGDRWGDENTFMLGPTIIKPFRDHHIDEKGITRHGFVETNGNNCMGTTVILVASLLLPEDGLLGLFTRIVAVSLSFGLFATNQFHKWSHLDNPPLPIHILQKLHIILPVDHHAIHHTKPHDCYYCITTGWLNPLLKKIQFFEFLEATVERLTGVAPYRDEAPEPT